MSRHTDPETGEIVDLHTVGLLIARVRAASTDRQRQAITDQILAYGTALDRIRKDLERKIDAGHRRLPMDRRTQAFTATEEAQELTWIDWLTAYERITDVLYMIEQGVLMNRWDRVVNNGRSAEVAA